MKQLLLYKTLKSKKIASLLLFFALLFSTQSFAEDTNCGHISGFEFSNGNSSITIVDDQEYFIGDLPSNFYVDLSVSGYTQSAYFKLENKDTGQKYNIGENQLPYTFPGGNGAWSYGTGEFEVEAKIFKYNDCEGSYCDKETIKFTITDTPPCGTIAGFEFSNGSSTTTIVNDAEYFIGDLPNNFYVDVIVAGFSESALIKVKNRDTGQEYTIGENYLPYTFPAGNGAWSLGTGEFEIEAKIFEFNGCVGSYCDKETIKFRINNSAPCGQIDGLEFSNGSNTVAIANGGSYDVANLPFNFYVNVMVSGMTESAYNKITNLDTGAVHTNGENVLPYTYPSGNQAWTLGTGTFQFYSEIFKYDNCAGTKCDHITVTFTIFEQNCGDISGYEFSNGTDTMAITDGGTYDINTLPANFYVDGIVAGQSESFRFEVENLDTNETYNIIENYLPYTFPAGNGAWFLGTGTFEVKGSLFSGNYCNSQLCDESTLTFTLTEQNCGSISGFEFSNFSADPAIEIVDGGSYNINNIPSGFNINILTSGSIESAFNTLTNTDTGEVFTNLENVLPYTYPGATNLVWTNGCGSFHFCSSIFENDGASGAECDSACITFTITGCDPDPCLANAGTTVVDNEVVIWTPTANPVVTILLGVDAVLPPGGNYACLISKGVNDAIRFTNVGLSIALEEPGNFKVHLLAYDPTTLDLTSIVLGTTTINDLQNTIAANELCAALDGTGVSITVINGGTDERVTNTSDESIKGTVKEEVALTVKTDELPSTDNNVDIKLYPNPAVDNLNVEVLLLDAEVMNYNMIDLNGRQVLSGSFDNSTLGKTKVNTSKLSNGLYIITFESNFRSFSKKVQVNH